LTELKKRCSLKKKKGGDFMAKVSGPLLSMRAKGSVFGTLTYSERATGAVVGKKSVTPAHDTPGANAAEAAFSDAVRDWDDLTPDERREYNNRASQSDESVSGRCLFFRDRISEAYSH
jgi:hypothetical protein